MLRALIPFEPDEEVMTRKTIDPIVDEPIFGLAPDGEPRFVAAAFSDLDDAIRAHLYDVEFLALFFFGGTFAPFSRASERPIAMACSANGSCLFLPAVSPSWWGPRAVWK